MSIYKRGDNGMFYMNFVVNGIRVNKSTGKTTKKEAKHVEALERQKLLDEEKMTPQERVSKMMLSEAVEELHQVRWKNNKDTKNSLARANKIVEIIGDMPIGKINQATALKLIVNLQSRGNKPSTVNRTMEILKTILRYKKQEWDFIQLTRVAKGRIRVVSKEEEAQVVKLFRESKHSSRRDFYINMGDLVICLVDTGMRLGEMLKLKYEDINFDSNLISIWINKGGRPRSIPMTKRVRAILEARQLLDGISPFHLTNDKAITAWQWVRKQMGLEKDNEFVLHALRHTCASRLLFMGVDLVTIKEWLGHADIQTTMRYAHLAPNKLSHAAAILDSFQSSDCR